jgi:hypothetical protein
MKPKYLFTLLSLIGILLNATLTSAASLSLTAGSVTASPDSEVAVPIQVKGADNVGAVQFELTFDNALLTPVNVKAGSLAANALVEFNSETPGRLAVGLATVKPIKGDGELVTARFKVNGKQGQVIPLTLANAQAWDETTLNDILVKTEPGQITVNANQGMYVVYALVAVLGCLGMILVILIVVWLVKRRNQQ